MGLGMPIIMIFAATIAVLATDAVAGWAPGSTGGMPHTPWVLRDSGVQ